MSGKYQAYPEYKSSGVEWLGDIPFEWEMWKLSHAYEEIGSGTTPPTGSDEWYGGNIPWVTTGELRESVITDTTKKVTEKTIKQFSTLRVYPKGSVAIAMYGATIGRLGIFGIEATTNQACCVLTRSSVISNKYLYYWLQAFRKDIVNLASGGGQPNINQEVVASLRVSSPKLSGQVQIANFLDHETAKIDTLIEEQQSLIRLLKEKRQAVISHAVTKGLNPDAPMKDSGVEWLGEVPEHWGGANKLKNLSSLKGRLGWQGLKADEYKDQGPYVVSSAHFFEHQIQWELCPHVTEERYSIDDNIQLSEGDILLMKDGAAMGKLAFIDHLPDKACLNSHLLLFRPLTNDGEPGYIPKFLFYFMQTDLFQSYIQVNGTGATFFGVSQQAIGNYRLVLPPLEEQEEIVDFLNRLSSKLSSLESDKNQMIQLLKERRTALVSAAVTGKIDVRNWVAPTTEPENASCHSGTLAIPVSRQKQAVEDM